MGIDNLLLREVEGMLKEFTLFDLIEKDVMAMLSDICAKASDEDNLLTITDTYFPLTQTALINSDMFTHIGEHMFDDRNYETCICLPESAFIELVLEIAKSKTISEAEKSRIKRCLLSSGLGL